tara:strand:- start:186 stop:662 length:477 start_codon:yes stop_codon:yes gene_type:complete
MFIINNWNYNYEAHLRNTKDNLILLRKIFGLSLLAKKDFAECLSMTEEHLKDKLAGEIEVKPTDIEKALDFAKENGYWDEYGFKLVTDNISSLYKRIIDFSNLPVTTAADMMGIAPPKLHKLYHRKQESCKFDDLKKLLKFAADHRLQVIIAYCGGPE